MTGRYPSVLKTPPNGAANLRYRVHRPRLRVLDGSAIDSTPDDSRSKSLRRSTQFSSHLSRPHPSTDPHASLYWSNKFGDSPDWPRNRPLRVQPEGLTRRIYTS